jgi:hypothetical protein
MEIDSFAQSRKPEGKVLPESTRFTVTMPKTFGIEFHTGETAMPKTAPRNQVLKTRVSKRRKIAPEKPEVEVHPHILRRELISRRAYEIYLDEGCIEGRQLDHWFRAENEIDG